MVSSRAVSSEVTPGAAGSAAVVPSPDEVPYPTAFFGHPRGLATLGFTEFWERFSYYGMRALLILFMTADGVKGGLGFATTKAGAIYGLYTASVYLACLPGGWIADRLIGQRRAVLAGGCIITLGHFAMAVPSVPTFYLGLALIVAGTGLIKPNASTMVGELYPGENARRDAGFSIFYMLFNLGATVAPLICGWLGEKVNWHMGFAAAGLGMALGVVQYVRGGKYLGRAGLRPNAGDDVAGMRRARKALAAVAAAALALALLMITGVVPITAPQLATAATVGIIALAVAYFLFQFAFGGLDRRETRRMLAIMVLFIFSVMFWLGFEQAGSSLNLFAERMTDRGILGWQMPASVLQTVDPAFIILLAPLLAWLWIALGRRNPSSPAKFAVGLLFMALGFGAMVLASLASVGHALADPHVVARRVSMWWLVLTYLFSALGELCLSPVGLSTVTKLAPHRKVSQMMGIWFLSLSLGNLIGGQIAGRFEIFPLFQIFGVVALVTGGAGIVLLVLVRPIRVLMSGAE